MQSVTGNRPNATLLLTLAFAAWALVGNAQAIAQNCESDDLRRRAAFPSGAECKNDVYDIPTPDPAHLLQVSHTKRTLPFKEFDNSMHTFGAKGERRKDTELLNFIMSSVNRNEFSNFKQEFDVAGNSFRWLNGSETWLTDWNRPYPPNYMPTELPNGSCVHAKFEVTTLLKGDEVIRNEHMLDCWYIDFEHRQVLDERIGFYESFITAKGGQPWPAFDADAAALFKSLRPPR